ncbi:MAG: hypothetical protein ACRDZU_04895 [Acidimicrobiales bacterium]
MADNKPTEDEVVEDTEGNIYRPKPGSGGEDDTEGNVFLPKPAGGDDA